MRTRYSTKPREQISAVLRRERRYLSAAEIYSLLRKNRAKVSLSTVYRTLDLLTAKGEAAARLDEQGENKYVTCEPTHHHHAICRHCNKVQEVPCEAIDQFATALRERSGFELGDHELAFFGRCASCR